MKWIATAWLGMALAVYAAEPLRAPTVVREGTNTATTNDEIEKEYQKLLALDDTAQAEADQWIRDNEKFAATGAGVPRAELSRKIMTRFEPVRAAYEAFITAHPKHARARVAYGGFLNDIHDEDGAQTQWEKALELDPSNPAVWNNLANHYTHDGPILKAFEYYSKAIQLNPQEPVYYHNFGTTVYLFRNDSKEFFHISEQQVFDKALELYSNAMRLDRTNFPLASDVAQTYYGIKPQRTDDALRAWTNALAIANDEIEREGVYIHFARVNLIAGRFDEARRRISAVTNAMYDTLKTRLARNIETQEQQAKTNKAPATVVSPKTNAVPPTPETSPPVK